MSTRSRGRGAFERGARGTNTRGRGTTPRGVFNGRTSEGDGGPTTNPFTPRGPRADRGQRGGTFRGGTTSRGHSRARGGQINSSTRVSSGAISNSTPHPKDDYPARLQYLREERPHLKQQLIDDKLMNPDGQIDISQAVPIIGICPDMCPEFERVRRIVEKDLKVPEYTPESLQLGDRNARVPDESRMVKAYARPAAGNDADMVTDIRSPSVCLKTMNYMIERLDGEELDFLHGWLWDRTRAVRKDLNQQRIDKAEDIAVFQTCFELNVRLLLICLHHMARSASEDYSHKQDVEQLGAALLSLKYRYADNRRDKTVSPNEAEFQAYRLILAAQSNDNSVETEIQSIRHLQQNRRVQTALEILRAGKTILARNSTGFNIAKQNWKNFWDLVKSSRVSYLMACAAEVHFSKLRHTILDAIYKVYRQKAAVEDLKVPWLLEALGFDNKIELRDFCQLYGFSFGTSKDGDSYLDMESGPFKHKDDIRRLDLPLNLKEQTFSRKLVESKRKDRLLSAVIKDGDPSEACEEDSLFVKDDSALNSTDSAIGSGFSGISSGQIEEPSTKLNPFANPFQPHGTTAAQPLTASPFNNPFTNNGTSSMPKSKESPFAGFNRSTLFNTNGSAPSTFGRPSAVPEMSSSMQASGAPATDRGIFTSSPATGQTVQPGLFNVNKDSIKFSSGAPFGTSNGKPATAAPQNKPADQLATSAAPVSSFFNASTTETERSGAATSFPTFSATPTTGSSFPSSRQISGSSINPVQPTSSSPAIEPPKPASFTNGSALFPRSSGQLTPTEPSATVESERKAQEEQRRVKEEQERQKQEEQEQRAREEEQRRARELERKAQEERERRAKEEKARIARQEQERREQERRQEMERQETLRRQKEATIENLTNNVFLDPIEGLLAQFIEQQIRTLAPVCAEEVEQERAEQLAKEHCERKRIERIRSYCLKWYNMVVKKKNRKRARNRRQWLKENAERLTAMEEERIAEPITAAQATIQRNEFKRPEAPASASVPHNGKRPTSFEAQGKQSVALSDVGNKKRSARSAQNSTPTLNGATPSTRARSKTSYAPIDRTETDYFKLRAMGLDPSKHRKRSFDSDAGERDDSENDRKRARTSISSTLRPSPPLKVTPTLQSSLDKEDDLIARYNALKATYRKPATTSMTTTPARALSVRREPRDLNAVIAQARAVMSNDTSWISPKHSQHEFSRSVPDLTSQPYSVKYPAIGKSNTNGTAAVQEKPAYWGRVSRFVPRALYGKGVDAIRDYWSQSRGTSSTASSVVNEDPLNLSSPIPMQKSYVTITQDADIEYAEEEGDVEDEDELMSEQEDEEDEVMSEQDENEQEYSEDELYDEEEEYEEEEPSYGYGMQYKQNGLVESGPGGTEDDAIELSD